jgi:hypothetical protein
MFCRDALSQRTGGPLHGGPGNHAAVSARLSALEERPRMSPHRLGTRLTRLEPDAHRVLWVADVQVSLVRLMAEASTEIGLAPSRVQALCAEVEQTCHLLSAAVPACVTALQAVEAFMAHVSAAVVALLDTHVTDPSTRYRLRQALSQACQREALRRGGRTA